MKGHCITCDQHKEVHLDLKRRLYNDFYPTLIILYTFSDQHTK